MQPDVPLVVPEVNPESLRDHKGIVANPNCVAIILTVAVAPIHRRAGIRRIVVSTYQSASGAGLAAMEELKSQARQVLDQTHAREGCRNRAEFAADFDGSIRLGIKCIDMAGATLHP